MMFEEIVGALASVDGGSFARVKVASGERFDGAHHERRDSGTGKELSGASDSPAVSACLTSVRGRQSVRPFPAT